MAIEFDCPACGATVRVAEAAAGKKGRCPGCRALLAVPQPTDVPPRPPFLTGKQAAGKPAPPKPDGESAPPPSAVPFGFPPEPAPPAVPPPPPMTPPAAGVPADFPAAFEAAAAPRASRRRTAKKGNPWISGGAAALGLALVVGVGWWLVKTTGPSLSGRVTGARFDEATLPPTPFAPPFGAVPRDEERSVLDALDGAALPIRSRFVGVEIDAAGGQPRVTVSSGPQADAVRVPLSQETAVRAALPAVRDAIQQAKTAELRAETAALFHDYAAVLRGGGSLPDPERVRDGVGFNAATGPLGYAVEAVVAGVPFRCVHQDAEGRLWFFLPRGVKAFTLRGRTLPDGSAPLPLDYAVTVLDAPPGEAAPAPEPRRRPGGLAPSPDEPEIDGLAPRKPKPPPAGGKPPDKTEADENG